MQLFNQFQGYLWLLLINVNPDHISLQKVA